MIKSPNEQRCEQKITAKQNVHQVVNEKCVNVSFGKKISFTKRAGGERNEECGLRNDDLGMMIWEWGMGNGY